MRIILEATGDGAAAALAPVRSYFAEEWGAAVEPAAPQPAATPPAARDDALIAVVAIVLSMPGNILAAMELTAKARLRTRLDAALQHLRDALRGRRCDVALRVGDRSFDLRAVTAEEVLDAIAEAENKAR